MIIMVNGRFIRNF